MGKDYGRYLVVVVRPPQGRCVLLASRWIRQFAGLATPGRQPWAFVRSGGSHWPEDEFNDWSKAVYHEMVDRCEKAKGEASDPPATGSPGARGEGCGCSSAASKEAIGDAASGRWLTGVAPGSPTRREEGSPRA